MPTAYTLFNYFDGQGHLEFQDQFTLKAFGPLQTRMPNGQSGFSLLIVISSEFTPIQLGFGFKLEGVGGLLGLNRTVRIEPLRAGLRDNTLRSILFPTDVVANADRILSDLQAVFPPEDGRARQRARRGKPISARSPPGRSGIRIGGIVMDTLRNYTFLPWLRQGIAAERSSWRGDGASPFGGRLSSSETAARRQAVWRSSRAPQTQEIRRPSGLPRIP